MSFTNTMAFFFLFNNSYVVLVTTIDTMQYSETG